MRIPRYILARTFILLTIGLLTTLGMTVLLAWYRPDLGMKSAYAAHLPASTWKFLERVEAIGVSDYEADAWVSGAPPAKDVRRLFRAAPWKSTPLPDPALDNWASGAPTASVHMYELGWPCRCFWGAYTQVYTGSSSIYGLFYHRQTRFLCPYVPIPSGLILDSLFWSASWWLALLGFGTLRTHLRRRRNLCPHCAYSLLNLPPTSPCPECGGTHASHASP